MKQTLTAYLTQEDGWYVAQCLEVDVASQGESEAEAMTNLREALSLHFTPPVATELPRPLNVETTAPVELCGQRALLIPMASTHAPALYAAGQEEEIWRWMPQRPRTLADFQLWVRDALADQERGAELPFVIVDRETGGIVGSTRLVDISLAHRHAEIGWTWHMPCVWRTRINTECKYLLLRHAFERLLLVRVCLKTDARNLRSQKAIERLGAVKEGVLRRHRIMPDGYVRDSVLYSIIAEEWPAVERRLESFLNAERQNTR